MDDHLCSDESEDATSNVEHRFSLNDFPDELLILIFNRVLDLKCLCLCSLVSPRFSSLILLHVHSITFTVPRYTTALTLPTPPSDTLSNRLFGFVSKPYQYLRQFVFAAARMVVPPMISSFYNDSFISAVYFLSKFKSIRSFHLILPSSPHNPNPNDNESLLFKWTAKFGPKIDTLIFLSASSIRPANVYDDEPEQVDENELLKHRVHLAYRCLKDAIVRHRMLLFFIKELPFLQYITITDSENQGYLSLRDSNLAEMRNWIILELKRIEVPVSTDSKNQANLSLRDSLLAEMRSWINSARLKIYWLPKMIELPVSLIRWHVPMLELPMSGKVMKSATLVLMEMVDRSHLHRDLGGDAAAIANLFEKEEEEFGEAIVEMMVNHQSRITVF